MVIRQGDLFWLDLGSPRGSAPAYRRPCVVIQNDVLNCSRLGTTIVCAITSNLERARAMGNVALGKGEGNLPRRSVVNVSQLVTVDKAELTDRLGSLSTGRVEEILDGVNLILTPLG